MKRALFIVMMALMVIATIGFVSAYTAVAGKIYNVDFSDTVKNATVEVNCTHDSTVTTKINASLSDGTYAVKFMEANCDYGDSLSVHAFCTDSNCRETISNNVIVGENTVSGTVNIDKDVIGLDANIGVVNVPLIPEFGLVVGMFTVLSAVVIFFIIRRK